MMFNKSIFLTCIIVCFLLHEKICHTQTVDIGYSTIDFPYNNAYINTKQPTITGSLYNERQQVVFGETVHFFLNGELIGSTSSDEHGIYSYTLEKQLLDGVYAVTVLCVDSEVIMGPIQMNIDTSIPTTIILYPNENDTIQTNIFTVLGTTEKYAMVTTYLDNDTYGQICYADQGGAWSIDYPLENGAHTLMANAIDIAGNQGPLCDTLNFTVSA